MSAQRQIIAILDKFRQHNATEETLNEIQSLLQENWNLRSAYYQEAYSTGLAIDGAYLLPAVNLDPIATMVDSLFKMPYLSYVGTYSAIGIIGFFAVKKLTSEYFKSTRSEKASEISTDIEQALNSNNGDSIAAAIMLLKKENAYLKEKMTSTLKEANERWQICALGIAVGRAIIHSYSITGPWYRLLTDLVSVYSLNWTIGNAVNPPSPEEVREYIQSAMAPN